MRSMYDSVSVLLAGGFEDEPVWWPSDGALESFRHFLAKLPELPGVYAIVVDDVVCYVGKAQKQGIANRLKKYTTANKFGSTARNVRSSIGEALMRDQKVRVLYLTPSTEPIWHNNLPINLIEGIEAGLIEELKPAWNRRGLVRDKEDEEEIADV